MEKFIAPLVPFLVMSACSSGGTGGFLPLNETGAVLGVTETELSIVGGGVTTTQPRNADLDRGGFVGAQGDTAEGNDQKIAIATGDGTQAAIVITQLNKPEVNAYINRSTAFEVPEGTAELTGTYVGGLSTGSAFSTINSNTPYINYASGDVLLSVSFDDMTIGGEITNRVIVFDGLPFTFNLSQDTLTLSPTDLSQNGVFAGSVDTDLLLADDPDFVIPDVATFEGLVGGDDTTEAVGIVRLGTETQVGFIGEVGVFSATE